MIKYIREKILSWRIKRVYGLLDKNGKQVYVGNTLCFTSSFHKANFTGEIFYNKKLFQYELRCKDKSSSNKWAQWLREGSATVEIVRE